LAAKEERFKKFAINKKAGHNYEILDKIETGIVLTGSEVKVVRQGKVSISDSYIKIKNGEAFVTGLHISAYESKGYASHDPDRDKKLLLHKREISKLSSKIAEKGLSVIPLSIYPKQSYIKMEIALVRGKKIHDKREQLKKKAMNRDMDRALGRTR
jgi:SsrA-binding protein